jgi:predicted ATPase
MRLILTPRKRSQPPVAWATHSAKRSPSIMPRCCTCSGAKAARLSNGFAYYLAMANVLTGWAGAAEGDVTGGLVQLREGLAGMRRLGAELRLPFYFSLLAETLARGGLVGEALASLSTGFAFAAKNGEEWAVAELHRVQGDLLAAQGKHESARASFRLGLEAARRSGSLAFARKLSVLLDGTAPIASLERF